MGIEQNKFDSNTLILSMSVSFWLQQELKKSLSLYVCHIGNK